MVTRKAQVTVEFLFAIVFILFVFLLLLGFVFQRRSELTDTKDFLEKKAECLRISSLISSVYSGGDGTVAKIKTDYFITIYNYSSVSIESIANITTHENIIAVLASEAGETTQTFYDVVNEALGPDWYKICFSDIDGSGCQSSGDDVDWNLINDTLDELIANVDDYNTIYLEDVHIQYNAEYDGRNYFNILEEWVSEGNSLILSEHAVCREKSSGSYPSTSYRCNPPGYNNDVWDIFNHRIYQRGGNYGNDVTVIINPDIDIFPNLQLGDTFDFEEDSYIEELSTSSSDIKESENLGLIGGFISTTNCICSSPSNGYCIRHEGSTTIPANATWTSDLEGNYDIKIIHCGENDGNDEWWIYKNNQQIDNWVTSGGEPTWQERTVNSIQLAIGDEIKLSCDRGTSSSYCRSDYVEFTPYYPGTDETADNGIFEKNNEGLTHNQGGYQRTFSENCPGSGSSRQCTDSYAWEIGYDNAGQYVPVDFNATFVFNVSDLGISGNDITSMTMDFGGCWNGGTDYCDNGDNPEFRDGTNGNFEVLVYNGNSYERLNCGGSECESDNTLLLGDYNTAPSWGNADAYNEFSYTKTNGFNDNYVQDDQIYIRLHTWGTNHQNNYEAWQEIDYVFLTIDYDAKPSPPVPPGFTVVAEYDDNGQPAIVYWEYGNGRVFYFGDFQVEVAKQESYSEIISDLIERAYYLIIPREEGKVKCSFAAESPFYQLTGDLTIQNEDGAIVITNETQ